MLQTAAAETDDHSPTALESGYARLLAAALDETGSETVADAGVDSETIDLIERGDVSAVTLSEAAAVLGAADDFPGADAVVFETRDHLLMGMTTAVLDVDTLAASVSLDLTGQELQQAIEGRTPLTLGQLAAIQSAIDRRVEQQ